LESLNFASALEYVWKLVQGANRYIDENRPWELAGKTRQHSLTGSEFPLATKEPSALADANKEELVTVMRTLVAALRLIGKKLWIFMPETSGRIFAIYEQEKIQRLDEILFAKRSNS